MRGSNERHFLLGAPTSFEKNYTSREANSVRRALIMLPLKPFYKEREAQAAACNLQMTQFLPLGRAEEKRKNIY